MTVATYWEFAVSSTHAVIGAVLGFGLVYGGAVSEELVTMQARSRLWACLWGGGE